MEDLEKHSSMIWRNNFMDDTIIIYGTNTWPFCKRAREAYGEKARFINVREDPEKLQEMLALTGGKRTVPVIVEKGKVTIGFTGDKDFVRVGGGWTV